MVIIFVIYSHSTVVMTAAFKSFKLLFYQAQHIRHEIIVLLGVLELYNMVLERVGMGGRR
jgi:hypothetical protein